MRYGILGDIHGNLSALEGAFEVLDEAGVDQIISVGDVVGYGAAPAECIRALQSHDCEVVLGNHDAAVAGLLDEEYFNRYARDAVQWTRQALGTAELDWLRALPPTVTLEHCQVAHGTIHEPEKFHYLFGVENARASILALERPIGFVGHSHIPISVLEPRESVGRLGYSPDTHVDLTEIRRAVINVGSVGQPRDEDPRLAVAIFDSSEQWVRIERHDYDIDSEARRIRDAGLPAVLADRLWVGI